jgi:phosphoribosylamine--glycine ligase
MKILIVGRGGREHALTWKIVKDHQVERVFVAPGNDGISGIADCIDIDENDHDALIRFAKEENIDLTIIGPEQPLADGIVNKFQHARLNAFGPTKEATLIESSKSFAKELMQTYNIPTAKSCAFTSFHEARDEVERRGAPIVIKADGLAAGKGVTVARTIEEALQALEDMMEADKFAGAGKKVVIEEYLEGEEFSLMAFVHRDQVVPMVVARDHKPAFDGDKGPNTGGMGAYSPVPQISDQTIEQAVETILKPAADALVQENRPFTGILYAGLILTAEGPKVIEFNARFGDPETQVVLPRLKNGLVEVITTLLSGGNIRLKWSSEAVVGVVLASGGYPGSYKKGVPIGGLADLDDETLVFHAGTQYKKNQWLTDGGRILLVARKAETVEQAREQVYREIGNISCKQAFYRSDIGAGTKK